MKLLILGYQEVQPGKQKPTLIISFFSCHVGIGAFCCHFRKFESKTSCCWTGSKTSATSSTKASFIYSSKFVHYQFTATCTTHPAIPSGKSGLNSLLHIFKEKYVKQDDNIKTRVTKGIFGIAGETKVMQFDLFC